MVQLKFVLFFCVAAGLISCSKIKSITSTPQFNSIASLHLLGESVVPYNLIYNNTTVGGLSGIDYDSAHNIYYLISDDRSAFNPARFYTASISFTQKGIDAIHFTGVHNLLQFNGSVYPNSKADPYHTPDPEAMRYNPVTKLLTWSSEGERIVNAKDTVLEDPAVTTITTEGKFVDSIKMPANLVMRATENGPRQNGVLEGLTFADNYKTLYVSVEEPLYEDGPRVDVADNNTYTRILKFDAITKKLVAQFAYKPEPVAHPAIPVTAFKISGIPDILSLDSNKLLVIERSYSSGWAGCSVKVFIADLSAVSDITNMPLLNTTRKFVAASKKLLLNMNDLGIYIDNIEGVTFGPRLPNGHRTLLFIADNNFSLLQKSQLLLFEIIP